MSESVPSIRIGGSGSLGITQTREVADVRVNKAGDTVVPLPSDISDAFKWCIPLED